MLPLEYGAPIDRVASESALFIIFHAFWTYLRTTKRIFWESTKLQY